MTQQKTPYNKTAVTLFYDDHNAPTITAKGQDEIAEEIIALAESCGIPLFENPGLASFLNTIELGEEIPKVLYQTIAEIIAFAYHLNDLSDA